MRAWGSLTRLVDVHVVDRACLPEEGGVIELTSASGERAVVAALPFSDVGDLVSALKLQNESAARAAYAQGLADMTKALAARFRADAVNLLLAHTHIHGAQLAKSEREVSVGEQWAGTPEALPDKAHYVALGHIHKPQIVKAPCPARYAGSVMQLDFGEVGDEKSFVVIDAAPGKPGRVTTQPYSGTQPLLEVRHTLEELEREAPHLSDRGWLKVRVPLSVPRPGLASEVRKLLPNAVMVEAELPEPADAAPLAAREAMTERERFTAYLKEVDGAADPQLVEFFETLRKELAQEAAE
jgi:exonuclease SbcD